MATLRIALANLRYPETPAASIAAAERAIAEAATEHAQIICFPECFVPGYRGLGHAPPPPDAQFLERAWQAISAAAARAEIAVVLGTERIVDGQLLATALVIDRDGTSRGFQDKVQIDPSEDGTYAPAATGRRVFDVAGITIGVAICHEGWRYPETVRWPARHGAQLIFHPHLNEAEPGSYVPSVWGESANSFHERSLLSRAAENTCFVASVNYASPGSPTTSAIARPDGTLVSYQPYGRDGLLIADLDLAAATLLLARRFRDVVGADSL